MTPILLECIEPPDVSTIERSFESLHQSNFISDPSDEGEITTLGSLVVALGIDLTLGALVGLGIQFGVGPEAIQLAAILSFPKTPWAMSSPLYHDTDTFNDIVSKTFVSRCIFDAGLYSDPLAISNLLHDYAKCKERKQFCHKHRVSMSRMHHLSGTVESLKRRVANCLKVNIGVLETKEPARSMAHAKINILRILQVWLFCDTMIVHSPSKKKMPSVKGGAMIVQLEGPPISRGHLAQVLDRKRHPFELASSGKVVRQGNFNPEYLMMGDYADYFQGFDTRFASYVLEKKVDFSFYFVGNSLKIFVPADIWEQGDQLKNNILNKIPAQILEMSYFQNTGAGNQRGIRGRACGAWYPQDNTSTSKHAPMKRLFVLSTVLSKSQTKHFKRHVDQEVNGKFDSVKSILSCNITWSNRNVLLLISSSGECNSVSNADLNDLFSAPDVTSFPLTSTMKQCVKFPLEKTHVNEDSPGEGQALINDLPEGARLLSVLASERRRENFIRFSDGSNVQSHSNEQEVYSDVNLPKAFRINGNRWKRMNGGATVYVPVNCIPVSSLPIDDGKELFCCCANTLELRGGACRVEGITMLPPGRLFVALALLCFGVNPRTGLPVDNSDFYEQPEDEKKESIEPNSTVQQALNWIHENEKHHVQQEYMRVVNALHFHEICMEIGETLTCQPDKIAALCALFDGVNGPMAPWDDYDLSLNAAMIYARPKCIPNKTYDAISSFEKALPERDAAESVSSVTDQENKPRPSKPMAMKPEAKDKSKNKNQIFACVSCNTIFKKWNTCVKHRDECCPGTRFSKKKAMSLAERLADNNPTPASPSESKGRNDEANVHLAEQQKSGVLVPKLVWTCQHCKEAFGKKKLCEKHIKTCSFVASKAYKPKMMYEGCGKLFESSKKCNSYIKKGCDRYSTAMDAALEPT